MGWWNRDLDSNDEGFSDLSYPPDSGGRGKLVVLGFLVPTVIAGFAVRAWVLQEAIWFGRGNSDMELHGEAARAMAVCYLGAAVFCHARWFWGLRGSWRAFEWGTVLALLTILGGCGASCYYVFR